METHHFCIQAKRAVTKNGGLQRAALGEIGNTQVPVKEQELKKQSLKEKDVAAPLPQINANEHEDQEDVHMEEEEQEEVVVRQFPEGVLDIDALEDQNNPQLCVEYAPAIYAYLREVEDGLSIRKDFLSG